MPRRMINAEIWFNEKIAKLSDAGRLLFIGIFSNADNEGRLKASPKYLRAHVFPYDEDKRAEDIQQLRDQCADLGLIRLYSKNGQEYLDLPGWYEHQSIRKDRCRSSELPSFEEADYELQPNSNQTPTKLHPVSTPPPSTLHPPAGLREGRGREGKGREGNTPQSEIEETSSPASDVAIYKDTKDLTYSDLLNNLKASKNGQAMLFEIAKTKWPNFDWSSQPDSHWIGQFGKMLKDNSSELVLNAVWECEPELAQGNARDSPMGFIRQKIKQLKNRKKTYRGEATHQPEDFKGDW